ncbi:GDSL-type esterase/lipase family protein [Puniceicoccus vermicola]|uniref:SGNH hydrolase-type esterase domain-containing protein n=1 Tax=Puniceicoccus vermicola TaxID=388746 RepID=A0A7X1B264_9BACT|nr:GDSL-type esterase/lipase family protein [Puniceicoccus vermicola]MBC2603178.1 hypothetical protein [Puniceicoccus vermicola]
MKKTVTRLSFSPAILALLLMTAPIFGKIASPTTDGITDGSSTVGRNEPIDSVQPQRAGTRTEASNYSTPSDPEKPLRIMPLGDSITVGYTNADWSGGAWESGYRSGLYTLLTQAGYSFKFVGSSQEPESLRNPRNTDPAYPPTLDLETLNQAEHNGYGGKNVSYLRKNILTWLAADDPDLILLKIGTNGQDQNGLDKLVDTITTASPDSHLIIAQIMPKIRYQPGIVDYNRYIRDTLVPKYQTLGRKVTQVDLYAPFLTDTDDLRSIDPTLFSNGINHPTNDGYQKMAEVWFEGIEALGNQPQN